MVINSKSIMLGGSLLFGVILSLGLVLWRKRKNSGPKLPAKTRWQPIGTLKNLLIFPMKSGRYVEIDQAECTEFGPTQVITPGIYPLKDRCFAVYRQSTKEIMLCMTYPVMQSIKIQSFSENSVLLKFKNKPDLEVIIPTLNGPDILVKSIMWTGEVMNLLDCGNKAADWISEVIKGTNEEQGKLRLGHWTPANSWMDGFDSNYNSRGRYQNYTSYMLMTSSSFESLAEMLPEESLTFKQFRPNFFVETNHEAYAEEKWSWVKIGEEATFMKISNCKRCCQINIDPETSKFNKSQEPLKTLKKHCSKENREPNMGICMGLYKAGKINVGDPVYIAVET